MELQRTVTLFGLLTGDVQTLALEGRENGIRIVATPAVLASLREAGRDDLVPFLDMLLSTDDVMTPADFGLLRGRIKPSEKLRSS